MLIYIQKSLFYNNTQSENIGNVVTENTYSNFITVADENCSLTGYKFKSSSPKYCTVKNFGGEKLPIGKFGELRQFAKYFCQFLPCSASRSLVQPIVYAPI